MEDWEATSDDRVSIVRRGARRTLLILAIALPALVNRATHRPDKRPTPCRLYRTPGEGSATNHLERSGPQRQMPLPRGEAQPTKR